MAEPLLQVSELKKSFGGLMAVDGVSLSLQPGRIKAIIGPNGAGKTTIFNVVTGIYPPLMGKVLFRGEDISSMKSHEIAALGISRTFQNVQLFRDMEVVENVMVGCHCRTRSEMLSAALRLPRARREEKLIRQKAMETLNFVGLAGKANELSQNLPLGEQKLLEVARALAMEPEVLLLDEPAAGLNDWETDRFANLIFQIQELGVSTMLVEHDMKLVMKVSDEIAVLNYGRKIAEGPPEAIQSDRRVIDAYLGEELLHI